jgi:acetyltransferase-like isoleucine patch superfamily enzyme
MITDFHAVSPGDSVKQKAVSIGDNVWIGANSMVLAGSCIGNHSIVAAGSIVTGEIPPKSLAAGNPARVIKTFDAPDDWIRSYIRRSLPSRNCEGMVAGLFEISPKTT